MHFSIITTSILCAIVATTQVAVATPVLGTVKRSTTLPTTSSDVPQLDTEEWKALRKATYSVPLE